MTTAVHSITPSELKNKIPDTSGLITTFVSIQKSEKLRIRYMALVA